MVNPGHASKGCATCKLRRIRCDYGRPFCLHCTKSKRICLGYNLPAKISHNRTGCRNGALLLHSSAAACQLTGQCPLPSLDHPKADDSQISYIDDFCHRLAHISGGMNVPRLFWNQVDKGPGADKEHLGMVVRSMLLTLNNAFYSLRQPTQTMKARKDLLQKYGCATRQLREALTIWPCSAVLLIPVFHFSLYEMIVNWDPADKTWQTHLGGLLGILQQTTDNSIKSTLTEAARISDSVTNVHKALESSLVESLQRAPLLLDIIKLQLRKLATEIDAISSPSHSRPPLRKLDVQKLQVSIKRIRKHLSLFAIMVGDRPGPTMTNIGHSSHQTGKGSQNTVADDVFKMQWVEFYTLQLMTSAILLKIGNILHPEAMYQGKREFRLLPHVIQEAADGICSIAASYARLCSQTATDSLEMPRMKTTQALLLIWPLFCISTAPGLTDGQKGWAREVLWAIGEQCSIPKALSLACSSAENITQSDILAGILLVNLSSILPNPTSIEGRSAVASPLPRRHFRLPSA